MVYELYRNYTLTINRVTGLWTLNPALVAEWLIQNPTGHDSQGYSPFDDPYLVYSWMWMRVVARIYLTSGGSPLARSPVPNQIISASGPGTVNDGQSIVTNVDGIADVTVTTVGLYELQTVINSQTSTNSVTFLSFGTPLDLHWQIILTGGGGKIVFDRAIIQRFYDWTSALNRTRIMDFLKATFAWTEEAPA